jgi:PD-(D/E)XK nuclease superfamily/Exodeoxyribonuclease V, gamma subunit
MDLHVYRNSQDRWYDLRSAARQRGAVLAVNAVTIDELVERLTPDVKTATPGQRLAVLGFVSLCLRGGHHKDTKTQSKGEEGWFPNLTRYAYDAVGELKAARVRPSEVRSAGASLLADILEGYDETLHKAGLFDPQDRRVLAGSRVKEGGVSWLQRFQRVVLHALYDLTEAEFFLIRSLIEVLPDGGVVILFNTTTNVKPTQFAEWTWQRFVQEESLAEKTFPEFFKPSHPGRPILERLFLFESHEPLPPDDSLRIIRASGRYNEVQTIGGDVADLLMRGESPNEIAVVVRHIETYGEMIEDVFSRYGIPHGFETGIPLLRIPFIKYWLALLDLVTNERGREGLARVMSSAYFTPRLSPGIDVERTLAGAGYIDRHHLRASALAARRNSPLVPELERFEQFLDELQRSTESIVGFLSRLQPGASLTERDRQAWRVLVEELEAVHLLPQEGLNFEEFRKLASEIAGLRTVDRMISAPVPPGVPRVRIVSPHSLGYREYKWIFAPGFADGEFPARSASNPLLSDETIEAINAQIRPHRIMTSRNRSRKEPLYLFMILDSAVKRVTLTYPGSTLEGEAIYPSVYVGEIGRHFADFAVEEAYHRPGAPVGAVYDRPGAPGSASAIARSLKDGAPLQPRGEGEWLSAIAREWRSGSITEERARELLGGDIVERASLESKKISRADIGRGALPIDRMWHPSELNSLSACPFVFLARHAMNLREAEMPEFEVPAMEIGILVHSILRDFYTEPVPASIELARARMNDIIARRLAAADISGQGPYSVFDPSLWKIRRQQVVSVLSEYVNFAVRDALDGFETQLKYLDATLPPSRLGETLLSGKPDHVAIHRTGELIDAIRIDDFKYSAASTSTARLLKESFQIPIYAYLALRALGADKNVRMEGRYLLLRSPGNPVVSYPIDETVFDSVRMRMDSLITKVRDGKLHPDPTDRQDCMDCEYRRLCRLYGG